MASLVCTTEKIPHEPAVAHFGENHLSESALALHHRREANGPGLGVYYRSGTLALRFTLGVCAIAVFIKGNRSTHGHSVS